MVKNLTSYFSTPPDTTMDDVAQKLHEKVSGLLGKGYVLHSVSPHIGVINGVSCTIGYTIIGVSPAVEKDKDELPIVIAA